MNMLPTQREWFTFAIVIVLLSVAVLNLAKAAHWRQRRKNLKRNPNQSL